METKIFLILPAIFKDWAQAQGLPVPLADFFTICGATPLIESYALIIDHHQKDVPQAYVQKRKQVFCFTNSEEDSEAL